MMLQTDENKTKIISIMGLPICDIPYYLTRILNSTGAKVLLIDNSSEHAIFNMLRKPQGDKTAVIGNIVVIYNRRYSETFYNQFDYVVVYHGYEVNEEINQKSDLRFLETDYIQFTTNRIKQVLGNMHDLPYHIIYRDKISNKITEKIILKELGIDEPAGEYILTYNESDYMCYLNLLRNGSQQLKGTSADMKDFFKSVMPVLFPEIEKKQIAKQYRKAISTKIR